MSRYILLCLLFKLCVTLPSNAADVYYHHLRLVFSADSDWAVLQWSDVNAILSCRLVSTTGNPRASRLEPDRLTLGQPLVQAKGGHKIGMSVDYTISPNAITSPMVLQASKGDMGSCELEVYVLTGSQLDRITQQTHSGIVPGSNGINPHTFRIDLSPLKDLPPNVGHIKKPYQKMVWAFYYPWYYMRDWSSGVLRDRPIELYSSDDPCTIARQIDQAKKVGIDGFISSWWGPNSYTDKNLNLLLRLAAERDFHICAYFETLRDSGPRDKTQIAEWLAYLIDTYRHRPGFFVLDGRPLIVLWASGSLPLDTWRQVIAKLKAKGLDAAYIGMGYDVSNLDIFDGIHEYGVFNIPNLKATFETTSRFVHHYQLLSKGAGPKLWIATAQPGYDDRLIPDRKGAYQDRLNGGYYKDTFSAAIASDPDWIFITTWNEWWEHTYIEPSQIYGDLYLRLTAECTKAWRAVPK